MKEVIRWGGITFSQLLAVVFIAFKLLGKITWSWWWVLSPLWLPPLAVLSVVLVVFFIFFIFYVFHKLQNI